MYFALQGFLLVLAAIGIIDVLIFTALHFLSYCSRISCWRHQSPFKMNTFSRNIQLGLSLRRFVFNHKTKKSFEGMYGISSIITIKASKREVGGWLGPEKKSEVRKLGNRGRHPYWEKKTVYFRALPESPTSPQFGQLGPLLDTKLSQIKSKIFIIYKVVKNSFLKWWRP